MKHIFHGRCKYNNCKAAAYADGLCYKHFIMSCEKQNESQQDNVKHEAKNIVDIIVNISAVLFVVLLWFICAVGAVQFGVQCYRYAQISIWKVILIAALILVLSYMILRFILVMLDRKYISKYIFTLLMIVFTVYVAANRAELYSGYTENIKAAVRAFVEGMKGILF